MGVILSLFNILSPFSVMGNTLNQFEDIKSS